MSLLGSLFFISLVRFCCLLGCFAAHPPALLLCAPSEKLARDAPELPARAKTACKAILAYMHTGHLRAAVVEALRFALVNIDSGTEPPGVSVPLCTPSKLFFLFLLLPWLRYRSQRCFTKYMCVSNSNNHPPSTQRRRYAQITGPPDHHAGTCLGGSYAAFSFSLSLSQSPHQACLSQG